MLEPRYLERVEVGHLGSRVPFPFDVHLADGYCSGHEIQLSFDFRVLGSLKLSQAEEFKTRYELFVNLLQASFSLIFSSRMI